MCFSFLSSVETDSKIGIENNTMVADISSEIVNLIKTKLIVRDNINIEENQEANTFTMILTHKTFYQRKEILA